MSATTGPFNGLGLNRSGPGLGLGLALLLLLGWLGWLGCADRPALPRELPADSVPNVEAQAAAVERATPETSGALDSARWTVGLVAAEGGGVPVVLRAVRTARQDGFDRIVLDFGDEPLPGYHIEYVDTPQHGCGSGEEIRLAGDAWLSIKLQVAQAHTDAGEGTVRERRRLLELPNLRELRLICDYEGHVEWVAGVGSPNPFRVLELTGPSRLVVDIRTGR